MNLKTTYLTLLIFFFIFSIKAQVGVNTTTPEGALDVSSSTQGFVPPRVALTDINTEAPVVNPQTGGIPAGTIVWNTAVAGTSPNNVAPGLYYWDGSRWISFAGSPGGLDWSLTGNSGTSVGTNFVGTTDATALRFRTNSTARFTMINGGSSLRSHTNGSAGSPNYSWQDDTDLGIYRIASGAGMLAFATSGTRRLSINQDGKIVGGTQVGGGHFTGDARGYLSVESSETGIDKYAIIGRIQGTGAGVFGRNTGTGPGVYGYNFTGDGYGVYGKTDTNGVGVFGLSQGNSYAIHGQNTASGTGVFGETGNASSYGVYGYNSATTSVATGVYGKTDSAAGYGVLGENTTYVAGGGNEYGVFSNGDSGATGAKTFRIDHPLDPENKYLSHFSIESNEVLNVYRGVEVFNSNGQATITLPNYYSEININPSYQLTPIGEAMPNLFVSKEITDGVFIVSGGVSGKKVSWQVTAERNDLYMRNYRKDVEHEKPDSEKGKYQIPELYNQPKEKGIFYREN